MSEQVHLASTRQDRILDDWIVVLEATTESDGAALEFGAVQTLLRRLHDWHATGLYNPHRYAVQLHVPAVAPYEALRCAVVYHDLEAKAAGLGGCTMARAEVMTLGEFESGLLTPPSAETPAPLPGRYGLVSEELYLATRALLCLSRPAEATEVLVRFVTAAGGSVQFGECSPTPGMIVVDLGIAEGVQLHAVAEAVSVAGMIIEQSLPSLVDDARTAVRHQYPATK
ncbi:MAG: hypothetical protein QOF20_1382 [Acidimicrobiaceae bacterium]|nr:hypothetical protein [Acidimicrobiaceae bacterium]